METIFMNSENSKANKPNKFFLSLLQRLDTRSSNKHILLQNLSIYCTWKNIKQQNKNNKLKLIVTIWNDKVELLDGCYCFQCRIFKIISNMRWKKHGELTSNPPIHIYINRINNRLVFKTEDGYKLELKQMPETINLSVPK